MKNKLILLGMILSFQLFLSDVFGQYTNIRVYPNQSATPATSAETRPNIRSLIPINNSNGNNKYLFLPSHTFNTPMVKRPEITILDNSLNYVLSETFTFNIGAGAVLTEAACIDPINYPEVYAISGAQITYTSGVISERFPFVFLYNINTHQVSNLIFVEEYSITYASNQNLKSTAGIGFINMDNPNTPASDTVRCIVFHTNSSQVQANGVGGMYPSSTLNLISMDPLNMVLTHNHSYDLFGRTDNGDNWDGRDLITRGNFVYTLANGPVAFANRHRSMIVRSEISFNPISGDFFLSNTNCIRRLVNGTASPSKTFITKLHLHGSHLIMAGTLDDSRGLIISTDLDDPTNGIFSPNPVTLNSVTYQDQGNNTNFSNSIQDQQDSKLFIASNSGTSNVLLNLFDLNTFNFVSLENDIAYNGLKFNYTISGPTSIGLPKEFSPIALSGNRITFGGHLNGNSSSVDGIRLYSYEFNALGLASPNQNNTCVSKNNIPTPLTYPISIGIYNGNYITEDNHTSSQTISLIPLNLSSSPLCSNPPNCEPLVAQVVNCSSVQLSVPNYSNVSWTDGINQTTTGPSISISDLDCHNIVYSYEGAVCTTQYKACIGPNQGVCGGPAAMNQNQTEMTRWTLDNAVTEFASAQKQMKDGNKHTLCYEKYSEKSGKFEQISCEEVQSTEDITKVEFDFTAYPSPASDQITIDVTNFTTEDNFKAILFTSSGSNIKEFRLKSKTAQYSLEGVNSGSYILTMYQGNKKVSSKTIIVRK